MSTIKPKVKKLYYSISEVSRLTKLKAYVLRYWETEFSQLKPLKNSAGNRTYRQKDIDVILNIKNLLYSNKFTIQGAKSILSNKNKSLSLEFDKNKAKNKTLIDLLKKELQEILNIIEK